VVRLELAHSFEDGFEGTVEEIVTDEDVRIVPLDVGCEKEEIIERKSQSALSGKEAKKKRLS